MILPWLMKKKARDLSGPRVRTWLVMTNPPIQSNPTHLVCVNIKKDDPREKT